MLETMFPKQITNDYKGSLIAKWVFVLVAIGTIGRSLIHMFAPDGGAQSIATIPVDTFTQNGAAAVVLIFAVSVDNCRVHNAHLAGYTQTYGDCRHSAG